MVKNVNHTEISLVTILEYYREKVKIKINDQYFWAKSEGISFPVGSEQLCEILYLGHTITVKSINYKEIIVNKRINIIS